ncbi:alpha/beta fold hydrolase [Protaetiibacter larvae]|nr:alpha/beta fold hydrolase [Protaetiibacter larvae]
MTTIQPQPTRHPILLLPGHWLGGWVWGEVAARLTELGHEVEPLTLPGLESADAAREAVTFADHVDYVATRIGSLGGRVVLVAHSGAGAVATAVADRMPGALARIVYVDSGPVGDGTVPRPELTAEDAELPFPGLDALAAHGVSVEGLGDDHRAELTARAVPHPAGACRQPVTLTDPHRHEVPTTVVCCSIPGSVMQELVASGEPMFAPLRELTDLTVRELPTGHWPMLSRPAELAELIGAEADRDDERDARPLSVHVP